VTAVIVERRWPGPLTDAALGAMFDAAVGCLATHRVAWRESLLSADGRDLVCHFSAPDAESVRVALRQAGSPPADAWAATVHDAPGADAATRVQANVLVSRRFAVPTSLADVQALEDAGAGCLQTHRVCFVATFVSNDLRRMLCLYAAPDAESVRIAQREAGMPVEHVRPVRLLRR
jgi:hypothetical protein